MSILLQCLLWCTDLDVESTARDPMFTRDITNTRLLLTTKADSNYSNSKSTSP